MPSLVSQYGAIAVAATLYLLAAAFDARLRRVPNWINLTLLLAGLGWSVGTSAAGEGWAAAARAMGGVILGVAVLYVPFTFRWIGGGDVKLIAASGAWLGPLGCLELLVGSALAGGLLSGAALLFATSQDRRRVRDNLTAVALGAASPGSLQFTQGGPRVPYGIGIAAVAAAMVVRTVIRAG